MIVEVATTFAHPLAVTVLVIVYVPAVLVDKVTNPVTALILNPAGEEVKVPAIPPPLNVGDGFTPLEQ